MVHVYTCQLPSEWFPPKAPKVCVCMIVCVTVWFAMCVWWLVGCVCTNWLLPASAISDTIVNTNTVWETVFHTKFTS